MKIICVNCSFRDENESDLRSIEHYLSSSENRENFLALKNVQLFVWSVKHTNTYQKKRNTLFKSCQEMTKTVQLCHKLFS